ncbi:conserved hypothetical protein [Echinococcus multilocularis]|uniref:Fe2OG dioxygenase domain-containing protein n=1 Tax=Echinococcus multilocularis TaxID=6211 RepID=A0A068Y3Z2_ECHMU|nr:conserved hypothetical protein [Echinococcus multilocularis]
MTSHKQDYEGTEQPKRSLAQVLHLISSPSVEKMSTDSVDVEERKRAFKFYKCFPDEPKQLENLDTSLSAFVTTTTLTNSINGFLEPSFVLQHNLTEEFFLLRSAIPETAFLPFYEEALFDWPFASYARNNLSESKIDSGFWSKSLLEFSNPSGTNQLLGRLRWVTLGYHYDWEKKIYPPGCQSQFPTKCGDFFKSIALTISEVIGYRRDLLTQKSYYDNFIPEASIVNYYRKKTTMGFHIDDSEACKRAPLVSISLGRPCIFLLEASTCIPGHLPHGNIGNTAKTIIPILLQHGDIMVTGGHSRLAYHAVPRLLSWRNASQCLSHDFFPSLLSAFKKRFGEDGIRENLEKYVLTTRLNVNVRQVNE